MQTPSNELTEVLEEWQELEEYRQQCETDLRQLTDFRRLAANMANVFYA